MREKVAHSQKLASEVEQLLAAYQGQLIRYAYQMVRDRQVAEEMVQEAFLRFVRHPPTYGVPLQHRAWFYRVVRNLCLDWLQRESKRATIYERIRQETLKDEAPTGVVSLDRWQYLVGLLSRLNEKQRQVILLFYQEGLSYEEIVEVTGFSKSNVGMLLHRGLKRMRKMMEAEGRTFHE